MKIKAPIGLVALAVAAILFGGDKPPQPPPPNAELVIIVEPIADGMYSTLTLHIEKEQLDEIRNSL